MEQPRRPRQWAALALALSACAGSRNPKQAISDVIARFSQSTMQQDFPAMSQAFSEHALWEAAGADLGFRYEGVQRIREALATSTSKARVLFQQIAPPLITLQDAEHASAHTSLIELLELQPHGEVRELFGSYDDELVKQGERWLFLQRRFVLHHQIQHPPAKEIPNEH